MVSVWKEAFFSIVSSNPEDQTTLQSVVCVSTPYHCRPVTREDAREKSPDNLFL